MIFNNAMSFKAKIKQISQNKGITTQQVQQIYLIEVFLVKLSKSAYKDNFIIKGGYLLVRLTHEIRLEINSIIIKSLIT